MIYFDHNATAPLHPAAREAWIKASEQFVGNPASQHRLGQRADLALDDARAFLAQVLECDPMEIVWTSGATEACNTVFHGIAGQAGDAEVWVSSIEHAAALTPAQFYCRKTLRLIPVESSGRVSLDWLADRLKQTRPACVAVMASNNETGVIQPWIEVAKFCREREVPFVCDATQWIGKLPARGLGACDFVIGSAHKFGGPRGVGFLKVPLKHQFTPLIHGGRQQGSRRAGTENVPGVLALVAALKARQALCDSNHHAPGKAWRDRFEQRLSAALLDLQVIGRGAERVWNTSLMILPDAKCAFRWVVKLDKEGFAVSSGSACASGNEQPSHVLRAMNFNDAQISNAVRFSAGWETPEEHWQQLAECICAIAAKL